jgi:hypothetical protein
MPIVFISQPLLGSILAEARVCTETPSGPCRSPARAGRSRRPATMTVDLALLVVLVWLLVSHRWDD